LLVSLVSFKGSLGIFFILTVIIFSNNKLNSHKRSKAVLLSDGKSFLM
jgi:hypothetical protein